MTSLSIDNVVRVDAAAEELRSVLDLLSIIGFSKSSVQRIQD